MDITSTAAIVTVLAGVIVWSIRQEGRINEHDQLFAEREKQTIDHERRDTEHHREVINRMDRLDTKLDAMAGIATTAAAAAAAAAAVRGKPQ